MRKLATFERHFMPVLLLGLALHSGCAAEGPRAAALISDVDVSLKGSQKYVLRVDGRPYYGTNIQIRMDKLRYAWDWDAVARDAIVAQAAADGFNTVSIPIHWHEVEPTKDTFDWTILDEYLGLCLKHKLKMELLWFGQNSGGHVQWLGDPRRNPVHLRTPDYVLYSPGPESADTTSEFTIKREMSNYTLDLADNRLRAREALVLGKVMAHVAAWDLANGSRHTVIGVQVGNEVRGFKAPGFPAPLIVSYLSDLGAAVKASPYRVWTRANCVHGEHTSRINANEEMRTGAGTNLDFVGIDLYTKDPGVIRSVLPKKGRNYRMIMECGAEVSNAAQLQLAALAGDSAYDHYDMIGPDGHGLYDRAEKNGFVPHGDYIADVRTVNKLLNSAMTDVALNAQGQGLFVHNWSGKSADATTGVEGIIFTPGSPVSQAVSIRRSNTEIVLMNTKGGTFTLSESLSITDATSGYFDRNDRWVKQGQVPMTKPLISPDPGQTVRLVVVPKGQQR